VTFDGLSGNYATIVADPPWHYAYATPPNPGLAGHIGVPYVAQPLPYSSMPLDDIKALSVADVAAPDARLFMWTTNRYLRQSWSVVESWGFEATGRVLVWCKKPMGTLNVTTEFIIMAKRGRPPRMPWTPTTWYDWKRPHHQHSRKPDAFMDLVESWCPGPYVELFARSARPGWDAWGDEAPSAEAIGA
jgi:N6-adenosine-specific RNA methylase IME4